MREQVSVPICVGERLYTRWDFLPVLAGRLADYLMPDVVWTGGISEMMRIAALAETYHVPVTPHNAMGPLQVVAGAHAMLAVPNFYRLEHNVANVPWYNRCLDRPLDLRGDRLHLSAGPAWASSWTSSTSGPTRRDRGGNGEPRTSKSASLAQAATGTRRAPVGRAASAGGHLPADRPEPYSMTSSARVSIADGIVRPRALAVLQIEPELEARGLLDQGDWQVGALQDLVDERGGLSPELPKAHSVGHQGARGRQLAEPDHRHPPADGPIGDAASVGDEHPIVEDHQPLIPPRGQRIEGRVQVTRPPNGHVLELDS